MLRNALSEKQGELPARHPISRRGFVKAAATTALAVSGQLTGLPAAAAPDAKKNSGAAVPDLIDTNVTLGRWPFRRMPLDETSALVAKLRESGITQAWAGSFEGIFHKDVAAANAWLSDECRRQGHGLLVPFGTVNPVLPDWEEDLRRCAETYRMPGIRLHPSYHGYQLDAPAVGKLLLLAQERRLIVQIVADMEDERTQHALARAPHTDFKPLPALLKAQPAVSVMLLNWFRSIPLPLVKQLAAVGACFDIATVEGVGGVANLVDQISVEHVLFGTHAPLFYVASASLKLKESGLLNDDARAVRQGNARRLLSRR